MTLASERPVLSIVATSRNDDHGGNLKKRMRLCFNGIFALAERHKLTCELIIVEWNPPVGRPKLAEVLPWPKAHPYCSVRIIEVPPEIHSRYKHGRGLPLYQMIAKNVGIRRARGRFVLATNIDILFTDALFAFMASGQLRDNVMYRCDRHDTDGEIPEDADIDTQLRIAKETTLRVNAWGGTWNRRTGSYSEVNVALAPRLDRRRPHFPVHTNACGDFTLMSRDNWFELKAHWESDVYSFHLDSILCVSAFYQGIDEVDLPNPMWVHHIEHTGGWTPEIEKARTLDTHLEKVEVPRISNEQLLAYVKEMNRKSRPLPSPNDDDWGLAADQLSENALVRASWDAEPTGRLPSAPFAPVASRFARTGRGSRDEASDPFLSVIVRDGEDAALLSRLAQAGVTVERLAVPADNMPLAEKLNAVAHEARGRFLLFARANAPCGEQGIRFIAERRLDPDCFYVLAEDGADIVTADPMAEVADAAADEFLIVARERFGRLGGFPEIHGPEAVGIFAHMAHVSGLSQALIHARGGAPAEAAWTESAGYRHWCATMHRQRRIIAPILHDAASDDSGAMIEAVADQLRRVYFCEQSVANLEALAALARRSSHRTIVEIGAGHGLAARIFAREAPDRAYLPLDSESALAEALRHVDGPPLIVLNLTLLDAALRRPLTEKLLAEAPAGSIVAVSGIWKSPHPLDEKTFKPFFANSAVFDLDPSLPIEMSCADLLSGEGILGVGDIGLLVAWLNANGVEIETPADSNLALFTVPAEAKPLSLKVRPKILHLFNPAAAWRWREGEFRDPTIRRIIACCEAGERAYAEGRIDAASDEFANALVLFDRLTAPSRELLVKADQADRAGDRAQALGHFREWQKTVKSIGLLEGPKRILGLCELRRNNVKAALAIESTIRVDDVDPDFFEIIRERYIRTERALPPV